MPRAFRFCVVIALAGIAGLPAHAQNSNTVSTPAPPPRAGTVGPEQLRDFSLPGTNSPRPDTDAPARPAPEPSRAQPTPSPDEPAPSRPTARPAPSATVSIERRTGPVRPVPNAGTAQPSTERPASAVTLDLPPATPAPVPGFDGVPVPSVQPVPEPIEPASLSATGETPWWPWLLGAVLLGILGAMLWHRRSRRAEDNDSEEAFGGLALATPAPAPAPVPPPPAPPASTFIRTRIPPLGSVPAPAPPPRPAPAPTPGRPGGIVSTRLRASIDLELFAEAAVLDDNELVIQFELRISNSGSAPARDVVVEALVLNAGDSQEGEIATFFERADASGGAIDVIGPLDQHSLRSVVRMPRNAMREYIADGRRLLVPVIAFNAGYRFGSSSGRTSHAWLIGRGAAGVERLGPLRLDQGSRRWTDLSQKRLDAVVRR